MGRPRSSLLIVLGALLAIPLAICWYFLESTFTYEELGKLLDKKPGNYREWVDCYNSLGIPRSRTPDYGYENPEEKFGPGDWPHDEIVWMREGKTLEDIHYTDRVFVNEFGDIMTLAYFVEFHYSAKLDLLGWSASPTVRRRLGR